MVYSLNTFWLQNIPNKKWNKFVNGTGPRSVAGEITIRVRVLLLLIVRKELLSVCGVDSVAVGNVLQSHNAGRERALQVID